jgi:hypothetical protein
VAVICHSPSYLEASKIPDEKHRKRMLKKGHTVKLMYKTAVFCACSKARACATFQANFLRDCMVVLNHGQLHLTAKVEVFENGSRLPGGDPNHRGQLRHGLRDRVAPEIVPYATPCMQHLVDRSDNCGEQFMCAAAFAAIQNFPKDTAVKLSDTCTTPGATRKSIRSVPGEGKHVADGHGGQPQNVLKKTRSIRRCSACFKHARGWMPEHGSVCGLAIVERNPHGPVHPGPLVCGQLLPLRVR